mmetsp:Transcript_14723/g.36706  ORF Transcript_14723/g.36706 Transcript_14723/m.36706 type:complete len:205 (+) Transcript_14723:256-870(+)
MCSLLAATMIPLECTTQRKAPRWTSCGAKSTGAATCASRTQRAAHCMPPASRPLKPPIRPGTRYATTTFAATSTCATSKVTPDPSPHSTSHPRLTCSCLAHWTRACGCGTCAPTSARASCTCRGCPAPRSTSRGWCLRWPPRAAWSSCTTCARTTRAPLTPSRCKRRSTRRAPTRTSGSPATASTCWAWWSRGCTSWTPSTAPS